MKIIVHPTITSLVHSNKILSFLAPNLWYIVYTDCTALFLNSWFSLPVVTTSSSNIQTKMSVTVEADILKCGICLDFMNDLVNGDSGHN